MKKSWMAVIAVLFLTAYIGGCRDENTEVIGICPIVVSTNPANLAVGVPLNQVISVTFNKAMDPGTINASSFVLMDPGSSINTGTGNRVTSTEVPGKVTYNTSTFTLSFTPSQPLNTSTNYTGRVHPTVKDVTGNTLQLAHVWTFTTVLAPHVISTDPEDNAIGVPLNKVISAKFSMPMAPNSINALTFTLQIGDTPVPGRVTYADSVASFSPTSLLLPNTIYTANITVGAKNPAGSPMLVNHSWSFNTDDSPFVVTTDPEDGDVGVPLNKVISATFSAPMDASTFNTNSFKVTREGSGISIPGTVTFIEGVASFTPRNDLMPNTEYTGTINTSVRNTLGTRLATNYVWKFTTDGLPLVVTTDPANNATGVAHNKTLTASFNVPMNPATINNSTFTLRQGTTAIAGEVTYTGTTASFNPAVNLLPGLVYTATITTGATNLLGTSLGTDHVWTFRTDLSPTVISTMPANEATNIAINTMVNATFSVKMDPLTINSNTFTVRNGTVNVPGSFSFTDNEVFFEPTSLLETGTTYTVTITTGAKNMVGSSIASNYVWTFTTGTFIAPSVVTTDPSNGAIGVALNKALTATFTVAMDPATFTSSSFTLRRGTVAVAGTVSVNGTTATFTPNAPLLNSTLYTATITTAVKNTTGTNMATNYVWGFTTGAATPPTVVLTEPANGSTNIELDQVLEANFSVAMQSSTINGATFTLQNDGVAVAGTVTYSGITAFFTPNVALNPNTLYTATITTGAKDQAGTSLANNYIWTFTTMASTPPTVVNVTPSNTATNVALNTNVTATFNTAMLQSSITQAGTFTLRRGSVSVAGAVSHSGTTATFNPTSDLLPNTLYTATITNVAKNLAGIEMESDFTWTFTTVASTPPTVINVTPSNTASNVALNTNVTATFSTEMLASSITQAGTFTLRRGSVNVEGAASYSGTNATFNPTSDLLPNTLYTATITNVAKNLAGIAMANDFTWTFTTVDSPPPTVISVTPANNASEVDLNTNLTATFSTEMLASSITQAGTFTLRRGSVDVAGAVSYSGTTATFNPTSDLLPNTLYTATITTVAKNLAGIEMANDFTWTFTTSGGVAPTVILTDPLNNATGVALDKTVTATFSEGMLASSVTGNGIFTLKQGTTNVDGVVTYNGNTASFDPTSNLLSGTTYTATITTAAQNLAGTGMTSNHVWTFNTSEPAGGPLVNMLTAARFGILAGTAVSNNAGPSQINNLDVGVYAGTSITGFFVTDGGPGIIVNGIAMRPGDPAPIPAQLEQAKLDLTAAYNFARDATTPAPATVSGNQGGLTLAPGIYKSTSTLSIEGTPLTLDAQGDENAVWIFQIASGFTTTTGGSVILINGAKAKNIFWQVGSSAVIGDNTAFHGNILAFTSITMNSGATAVGRMLAINGAVTLTNANTISKPED